MDAGQLRQSITGFGASTAYYQNWLPTHPNKKAIYDALFKDLKLDTLRLQNSYRPEKGAQFAASDVDVVRGAEESLGHPITVMMSSWSPPAALKSNHSEKQGGTLAKDKKGAFVYDGFARFWYDSLIAYRRNGIVPTYISIQNEPDWKADWESCEFRPTEEKTGVAYAGYDRALAAVYRKLQTLPQPPRLLGPETLGIGQNRTQAYLPPTNKAQLAQVYGVAHHLYNGGTHLEPDSFVSTLRQLRDDYPNKPRFMTEFGRSNGFQTAWLIHNCLVEEEATSYIYWAGVWPGEDALITLDNPWKPGEWKHPDGFALTDRYWALKHYSYFIAPGYRRVETAADTPSTKVSAFLSPDKSWLIVVALNTSESDSTDLTLDLKNFTRSDSSAVYRTCAQADEQVKELGSFAEDNRITLPPRSIVTITLQGQGIADAPR